MKKPITDAEAAEWVRILDLTIHELVFAAHHVEEDNVDDAQTCMVTAQENLSRIDEALAKHEEAA